MKSPLIVPTYTHNLSKTINMFKLECSYMYCNYYENSYFLYESGSLKGKFYDNPRIAYNSLIQHEIKQVFKERTSKIIRYK